MFLSNFYKKKLKKFSQWKISQINIGLGQFLIFWFIYDFESAFDLLKKTYFAKLKTVLITCLAKYINSFSKRYILL